VDFRFAGHELCKDAAETQRVLADRRPDPVVAGSCRVSLVKDKVDNLEDRRQTRSALMRSWYLEGYARLGKSALRPDDPLRDGGRRNEECARDLLGRQPSQQTEGESNARLCCENWMTGHEDEA